MKPKHSAPLETEPGSVHAPYIFYQGSYYRFEDAAERHAALLEPLCGGEFRAYDLHILHWLAEWDASVVAVVVSLPWRARCAAAQETWDGGESR